LELAVLGSVNQRINQAVGKRQHNGEVVEPTELVRWQEIARL